MNEVPQESLRRHRQTLQPGQKPRQSEQPSSNRAYGSFLTPGSAELPSVQQKDKDKVGDLVKRRLSSRFPSNFNAASGSIPALPLNAIDLVNSNSIPPLPPSKYGASQSSLNVPNDSSQASRSAPDQFSAQQQFAGQNQLHPQSQHVQQMGHSHHNLQHQPSFDNMSAGASFPPTNDPDVLALRSANFNAKEYISSKLSSASDVEISKFTDKITRLKDQVAVDRQNMVYGNYRTFLAVGSQISVLSSELQALRKLVNDLHVATTAMKQDAENTLLNIDSSSNSSTTNLSVPGFNDSPNGSSSDLLGPLSAGRGFNSASKQNNRNSVLVLESMWAQDLSGLFRSVEGAQKYLPPIPGRHVVEESSGWDQLNAATWKPWQPVKVYLLNDYLLIAIRKRSKNNDMLAVSQSSQSWVADQCWPLPDIVIKDLSTLEHTSGAPPHGFAVHKDRNVYVYKHNDAKASARFFQAYNRLPREMRGKGNQGRRDATQKNSEGRPRDSIYGGINSNKGLGSREGENKGHKRSVSMDIAERTRVLRDIDTLINDLDVKIAHRNFSDAVNVIEHRNKEVADVHEVSATAIAAAQAASATSAIGGSISGPPSLKGRPSISTSMSSTQVQQTAQVMDIKVLRVQILKIKLDQRAKEISTILLNNVTQDYFGRSEIKEQIQLLIRLKQGEVAKKAFLTSRRQLILKRVKGVEFEGDIPNYISQIVTIHFRMVRATVEIYQTCFPSSSQASTIVEWAKTEVEDYVELFARQLYNISQDSDIYRQCVKVTKEQAEQFKKVGLNMDFLLNYVYEGQEAAPNGI